LLVVGSLTVIGLTAVAGSNLTSTAALQGTRNLEYAADAAVEGAIQTDRYALNTLPCPGFATAGSSPFTINAGTSSVYVNCTTTPLSGTLGSATTVTLAAGSCIGSGVAGDLVGVGVTGANVNPNTKVSGCTDATHLVISPPAGAGLGSVTVQTPGERVAVFVACTASTVPCPVGQILLTAAVHYFDTDNKGGPAQGYAANVVSWLQANSNG
jgi:hypothetical protein